MLGRATISHARELFMTRSGSFRRKALAVCLANGIFGMGSFAISAAEKTYFQARAARYRAKQR